MINFVKNMIKKMKKIILSFFGCIFTLFLFAQSNIKKDNTIEEIFQNSGEIYFKFISPSQSDINHSLTNIISISSVKKVNDATWEVFAYANKKEFRQFLAKGYTYTLLPQPASLLKNVKMMTVDQVRQKQTNAWDSYPTYAAYEAMMYDFQANHPALCKIDTILGQTPKGTHKLLAAHIGSTLNTPSNKPQFLYTSSIHGNELTGYIMMLRMIDFLLTGYGANPRVTNIVNNIDLWICPLANPDGTFLSSETSITSAQRGNYGNVDLNRNYPDPAMGQHPDGELWQAETVAFMNFASQHHFNMSANYHDGSELLNFPWDDYTSSQRLHADNNWWQYVCRQYADSIHVHAGTLGTTYFTDQGNGVTEGGDWYIVNGGRQDYMNYFHRCREVTIELSAYQPPAANTLPSYWNALYLSMLKYMEQSLNGVRGLITDSLTGQPLRAKVFITGHDVDSSHVYSSLPVGNYHRYLYTGNYNITFSAPCYKDKTILNVNLTNGNVNVLNVQLTPGLSVDFIADTTNAACSGAVQFNNLTTGASSCLWDFGDGSTSASLNPSHVYSTNGIYSIKLKAVTACGTDSVIKNNYLVINFLPRTYSGSHCGPGADTLSVTGTGNYIWYDAPSATTPIDTGNVFITQNLTSTTTYYVQNRLEHPVQNVGSPDNTGTSFSNLTTRYLIFDCYKAGTLLSVEVNAQNAISSLTVRLEDHNGNPLDSAVVTGIAAGIHRISLNLHMPQDTSLRLHMTSITGGRLFRNNNTGVSYPYELPGFIKIKSSDAGLTYYYFFYKWQVQQQQCIGPVMPVMAYINALPDAQYTFSVNSNHASFNSTSTDANTYFWNFDDGNFSTAENPSHTYADSGLYNVKLLISNACSSDSITQTVHILSVPNSISTESASVSVFPNPAGDYIYLRSEMMNSGDCFVRIYSVKGKLVLNSELNANKELNVLNISSLNDGLYIVTVCNGEKMVKAKFVRKR